MSERIYRTYLDVANLSEGTLSPDHALDIAEYIVRERPTPRARLQRLLYGASHDEIRARSMREEWRRNEANAAECTCGMAEQERTGHYPEHAQWCDVAGPDGFSA